MNEMTVPASFAALTEGSDASALLEANLGGGSFLRRDDLNWITIPTGGLTRWSWTTKSGAEFSEKSISGLLVVATQPEEILWPQPTAVKGSSPLLISTNGVVAYKTGSDYGDLDANVIEAAKNPDGTYAVAKIPYFQWQGKKKRSKTNRVVGLLREGEALPVFIRVSPTSCRPIDNLLRGITSDGLFHWQAIVELSLEKKKGDSSDYAVIVGKKIGSVSKEIGLRAKSLFTDKLTDIVCPPAEQRVRRSEEYATTAAVSGDVPF